VPQGKKKRSLIIEQTTQNLPVKKEKKSLPVNQIFHAGEFTIRRKSFLFVGIIFYKVKFMKEHLWLTPVVLATQKAEIRRLKVRNQPRQKGSKIPSQRTSQVWWYTSIIPVIPTT
jgi:hypothetical protein